MTKLTVTLPDGSTKELPEGFPTSQQELDAIRDRALAPKLSRVSELEGQVNTLTDERDALATQVTEKDQTIGQLESSVTDKDRALLVTNVAHKKGVPAKWLKGDDQAALEASADEFLADARGLAGSGSGEQQTTGGNNTGGEQQDGQEQQAGGYVGSAGTGDENPTRPSFEEAKQRAYERAKNQRKVSLT